VTVQLGQLKQEMAGFGINNNWAPAMTEEEADAMFDTTTGLGLSILRIGMGSSGNPFNGDDCWEDIRKASARGVTTFIGTLWSPPASCKTNNNENNGGYLEESCYESWSDTIAAFPAKVKQGAGVDLYAMSPQNEVDFASCGFEEPCNGNYPTTLFTAEQYVAFAKIVGRKLHDLNPPVKLMGPEASEWLHAWSNESACCSEPGGLESSNPLNGMGYDYGHVLFADKEAWGLLDIFGVHQYDTQVAEPWPSDVPEKKPVWQTEMSGVKWWPEQGPSSDINNAVAIAGWIHNALTVGEASAWLWWWWRAQGSTNEGLLLSNGMDTKRRYALGNYSRFVRPGYTRVDVTGKIPGDVLLTAFQGPDGTVVVVAINKGATSATVPIFIAGGMAPASLMPWVTSASDNLVSKTAVAVSGGSFSAELASNTVTTFVGR
jgi:glucuronoarabinoxylan endo-1,4-beta-xylanase